MPYSIAVRLSLAMIFLRKFETDKRVFSYLPVRQVTADILINTERHEMGLSVQERTRCYIYTRPAIKRMHLKLSPRPYYRPLSCFFQHYYHQRTSFARIYLKVKLFRNRTVNRCVMQDTLFLSELLNRFVLYMQYSTFPSYYQSMFAARVS